MALRARRRSRNVHQRRLSKRKRRPLWAEKLEDRRLLAADWFNYLEPGDVNNDGFVQPLDVLVMINELNARGPRELPPLQPNQDPPAYFDTSNDNLLSPLDVLLVINALNTGVPLKNSVGDVELVRADSAGERKIVLDFSDALLPRSVKPENFTLSYCLYDAECPDEGIPLDVLGASLGGEGEQVTLTTGLQQTSAEYYVSTSGLATAEGETVNDEVGKATFLNALPRVVGAISINNTAIVVSFSEPMNAARALDIANYKIYRDNHDAGHVIITDAQLTTANDRTAVTLMTMSQSDVPYTLHVINMMDDQGYNLAPPSNLNAFDPSRAQFRGTPFVGPRPLDTDGDGLSDDEEQRGWVVRYRLLDGTLVEYDVTSDPVDPNTDGDGFPDNVEKALRLDPRDWDTDGDLLEDEFEYNHLFGNPAHQDTDEDGIDDFFEHHALKTSPILADTDGDQIPDNVEIVLGNRNPLVADLPTPAIEVGDINLQLDVTFSETDSQETRELDAKTVTSTLQQSENREHSRSNQNTQEATAKLTVSNELKIETGVFKGIAAADSTVQTTLEKGWTGSWTSEATDKSAAETQRAYENSLNTEKEATAGSEVTRNVEGASMQVTLFLQNASDLAYHVKNLQVTAFIQDPQDPASLTPVATLLPDAEPEEGYALGPLVGERGPFILSSRDIFPELVESLMKNPRGLVFRISNFDIVDELDRNFAFTSQDIADRTAALVIDHGTFDSDNDGEGDAAEIHRVATGSGRILADRAVTNEALEEQRAPFDDSGSHTGITLRSALEAIGLTHYIETARGDASLVETPTTTLTNDEIESSYSTYFDDNGNERIFRIRGTATRLLVDNPATPEVEAETLQTEIARSWEIMTPTGIDQTIATLDERILNTGDDLKLAFVQDVDQDRLPDVLEAIYNSSDTRSDTDGDGLDDRFEALVGWTVNVAGRGSYPVLSSASALDSDGDGLTDADEAPAFRQLTEDGLISTKVGDVKQKSGVVVGEVYPEPSWRDDVALPISNAGSATESSPGRYAFYLAEVSGKYVLYSFDATGDLAGGSDAITGPTEVDVANFTNGKVQLTITFRELPVPQINVHPGGFWVTIGPDYVTDPFSDDTDGDGISDFEEVNGFRFKLLDGTFATRHTDPTNPDSDGDSAPDGLERRLGGDPTDGSDRDLFADDDGDGLTNFEETTGWLVSTTGSSNSGEVLCETTCAEGPIAQFIVTSDRDTADSDNDGLLDGEERDLGTNPRSVDTDLDGLTDFQEVRGFKFQPLAAAFLDEDGFITTNPTDSDTDNDTLTDGDEAGYQLVAREYETKRFIGPVDIRGGYPAGLPRDLPWAPLPNDVAIPTSNAGSATGDSPGRYTFTILSQSQEKHYYLQAWDPSGTYAGFHYFGKGINSVTGPTEVDFSQVTNGNTQVNIKITVTELPPLTDERAYFFVDVAERDFITSGDSQIINDERKYWIVRVEGTSDTPGRAYRVFSDPRVADRDYDKLVDGQEQENGFDPSKYDTDGDHVNDFTAAACGIKPGQIPIKLKIEATEIRILDFAGDGSGENGEISYDINYIKYEAGSSGVKHNLATQGVNPYWHPTNGGPGGIRELFNSQTVLMYEGDAIELEGFVREWDAGGNGDTFRWDRGTGWINDPIRDNYFDYANAMGLGVNESTELLVSVNAGTGNTTIPTTNEDYRVDFQVKYRITKLDPSRGCNY